MDELVFLKSTTIDETTPKIESKYTINIVDDNAKSYPQGSVRFNTTILQSNTDSFSVNDSDILIPMTTEITGSNTVLDDTVFNDYMMTVKNSFYDYIYSYSIKLNGTPVENETPFSNLLLNFKLYNETTSNNNVVKSNLAFSKNTGEILYSDVPSGNGRGECMNNTVSNSDYIAGKTVYNTNANIKNKNKYVNEGFLERCEMLNLYMRDIDKTLVEEPLNEDSKFINAANCTESRRSYFNKKTVGGIVTYTYTYFVTIPLNSFSFMKNMPLITAPKFEIALRIHTSKVVLTSAFTAQTNYNLTSTAVGSAVTVTNGIRSSNTITVDSINSMYEYTPFMLGDEFALKTKGNGNITISNKIGHSDLNSCYLRCGMINMAPQAQLDYYNIFGKLGKKIIYEKYLSTIFYEQQCNVQFRHKITTNASKILGLVVQTVLSRKQNGGTLSTGSVGTFTCLDSPFNASLNIKNCSYTNLNIRIGDKPIFQDNINYTYETYKLMSDSFLNGGVSRELPTSVISKHDFNNGYAYLFFDLSHRKSMPTWSVDNVIELSGKLNMNNNIYVDLYCFLITEESLRIDPSTSQLLLETE